MKIGSHNLEKEILIVAEIGNNHEGSYDLAEEMVGLAAGSGVDAVKFQTIVPEKLVSYLETDRVDQLKKFQLTYEQFEKLADVAINENVMFLSTPFDIESTLFLNDLVPAFKIASGDNNFFPLIEVIARTGKPIIMSTGLMKIEEIKKSVDFIRGIWDENSLEQELALLHCVSVYPTPPEKANLLAIKELNSIVSTIGYSDHTLGIEAAVLSVALGARIIEKHFTLDKNHSDFRDHSISADAEEMRELVYKVRCATQYLGNSNKVIMDDEKRVMKQSRRSIVAARDLIVGEKINMEDLEWVRPKSGLSPGDEGKLLGKSISRQIRKGETISFKDVN
jgi:N-acetylneuraminate synthase/N,N'-diacetyllegionaminate synthase|tara:strand:- start:750 stop:1757 length:1008 start_codon:yes stop_codon:yes gene_type:complete